MDGLFLVLTCILVFIAFCFTLIKYGAKSEETKQNKKDLEGAIQIAEIFKQTAMDPPRNDNDIIARLRGDKGDK